MKCSCYVQAVKRLREKKAIRPRTPPPARPSPPPNLRHRPSLRCPPRLAQQQDSDSDSGSSSQIQTRQALQAARAVAGNDRNKAVLAADGTGSDGGRPITRQAVEQRQAMVEHGGRVGRGRGADPRSMEDAYGRRSVPSGEERGASGRGRGGRIAHKRSLGERGIEDARKGMERMPQRPRFSEEPRSAIPADAVIVEVGVQRYRGHVVRNG